MTLNCSKDDNLVIVAGMEPELNYKSLLGTERGSWRELSTYGIWDDI